MATVQIMMHPTSIGYSTNNDASHLNAGKLNVSTYLLKIVRDGKNGLIHLDSLISKFVHLKKCNIAVF